MAISPSHRPASAIDALGEAISHMRAKLFPFSFAGWVTLGFVALLESCGSGSAGGGARGNPESATGAAEAPLQFIETALAWVAANMLLFVSALMFVMVVSLFFLWVRSRTVFIYVDDVATGRFDLIRPWNQHGAQADSFFAVSLVIQGAAFILMALILGGGVFFLLWARANDWGFAPTALGILPIAFGFFLAVVTAAIVGLVLRDFVAPIQLARGIGARDALGIFFSLFAAHPGLFIGYAVLKFMVGIAVGIAVFIGGCLTCCLGFLPLINQTLFQPVYFAERAWSLKLLAQLGEDVEARLIPPTYPSGEDAPTGPIDLSQIDFEK